MAWAATLVASLVVGSTASAPRRLQYGARHADILVSNLDYDKLTSDDRAALQVDVPRLIAQVCGIGQAEVTDVSGTVGKISVLTGSSVFAWSAAGWPPLTTTIHGSTTFSVVVTLPLSTGFLAESALQSADFSRALTKLIEDKLGPIPALSGELRVLKVSVQPVAEKEATAKEPEAQAELAEGENLAFGEGVKKAPVLPAPMPIQAGIPLPPGAHDALAALDQSEPQPQGDNAMAQVLAKLEQRWSVWLVGGALGLLVFGAAVAGGYHVLRHRAEPKDFSRGTLMEADQQYGGNASQRFEREEDSRPEERSLLYDRLTHVFSTRPPGYTGH